MNGMYALCEALINWKLRWHNLRCSTPKILLQERVYVPLELFLLHGFLFHDWGDLKDVRKQAHQCWEVLQVQQLAQQAN